MYIDPLVLDNKAMERDPFVHDLPITVHMANFYGHLGFTGRNELRRWHGQTCGPNEGAVAAILVLWCQRVPQGSPKIIKGRQCDDPLEYPFVLNLLLHISKMDNYSTRTHTHIYTYIHTCMHACIPYHTIPYHTIPYHTIPYHTIPYHTIPYHTIPYHTYIHTYIHTHSHTYIYIYNYVYIYIYI